MKKILLIFAGLFLGLNSLAFADKPFFQASLFDPIQLVDNTRDVSGLRLNLAYGVNQNVSGVDLGLGVGHTEMDFKGFGWHFLGNRVEGDVQGIEWAWAANLVDGNMKGWQGAFASVTRGNFTGLQWSAVNYTGMDFKGVQLAYGNITKGNFKGVQVGLVNYIGGRFKGLQLGIVNRADIADGLQIGLININDNRDPLFVFPFVNWHFE